MSATLMAPPETVRRSCMEILRELRSAAPGIQTTGVVGPDGFEVAVLPEGSSRAGKLAALTSTLAAVAHAFSNESGLRACRNLILESEGGRAIFLDIGSGEAPHSLFVVATDDATLGWTLSQARKCASRLEPVFAECAAA